MPTSKMSFKSNLLRTSKLALICSIAAFAFVAPTALVAQESVSINGIDAQRVIIAPPLNQLAFTIKQGLAERYNSSNPESRAYEEAQKLYFFYGSRHFEPLWLKTTDTGDVAFSDHAEQIMDVFKNAHLEGLNPDDYLTADLSLEGLSSDPADMATLETAFSAAAISYAQNAYGGRLRPRDVSRNMDLTAPQLNGANFLLELAESDTPADLLMELSPKHREFVALKELLGIHYRGEREEVVAIPAGGLLKPGMSDQRVPLLRERLGLNGITDSIVYDDMLVAAVEQFQTSKGLLVDGVIGSATVAAFNGGNQASMGDIVANMERWRWMPRDMGDFNVFVNIPEYRLFIYRDGQQEYTTRVVVGQNKHQTPVFSDEIEHVVMNPYWNVPSSITRNEIGPIVARNPGYLNAKNMDLISGGRVINAASVDWSTNSINNFRVRQRPGRGNALGQVKFLFPNKHAVYLHDTPSKSLFSRSSRAYSHGCVRVHNPFEFADALLANEQNLSRSSLESQRGNTERWNNLDVHVPVHIAYFTLRVGENGDISSFSDVYSLDSRLKSLLGVS